MSVILAHRGPLTAVDSAGVTEPAVNLVDTGAGGFALMFAVDSNVNPASVSVRAAVEISTDGVHWHQLVRFVDISAVGGQARIARFPNTVAAAEAAVTAVDMTAAAGATVLSDGGVGSVMMRAQTKLQTLTGASASVNIIVSSSGIPVGAGQT